jgi:hypothetical protein
VRFSLAADRSGLRSNEFAAVTVLRDSPRRAHTITSSDLETDEVCAFNHINDFRLIKERYA